MSRVGHTSRKNRAGFTLTEVMVSVVLTSFVIIGTWRFFNSASINMAMFSTITHADERLSMATDLISNDARMAGMFSTPYSERDPLVCPKPLTAIRGVQINNGAGVVGYSYGMNLHIAPDECIFLTPLHATFFRPAIMTENSIVLTAGNPDMPTNAADFAHLFSERWLRVTGPNGFHQFVQTASANFTDLSLTLATSLVFVSDDGLCGGSPPGGMEHEIAVLTHVRYRIIGDSQNPQRTNLVREELRPDLNTVVPATRLLVADNIVDLQCWADQDRGTLANPLFIPDSNLSDDQGSATVADILFNTERLRVMHFRITARTEREFDVISFRPRTGPAELLATFDLDNDPSNAALTLTSGIQVELSNFVVRNLR